VLDSEGVPVASASLATEWSAGEHGMNASSAIRTGEDGRFEGKLELYRMAPVLLLAYDSRRAQAGTARWDPEQPEELEIRLQPTVRVHGSFAIEGSEERPSWTNVYVSTLPEDGAAHGDRLLSCQSFEASFDFRLPPGTYAFNGYGTNTLQVNRTLEIGADDLDLGTLELPQTVVAASIGKPALPWKLSDARGISKDATLADFRGKWVVLEFWGYW
jgi:hypothetical protein